MSLQSILRIVKGSIVIIASLLYNTSLRAQSNVPAAVSAVPGATGTTTPNKPSAYPSGNAVNYMRSWQPQQPYTLVTDVINAGNTVSQVRKSTQYFDGLGRPVQTVDWQSSPGKEDMVLPVLYDAMGREQYKYLPYTYAAGSAVTTASDGSLKVDPFTEQRNFYGSVYPGEQPVYQNEQFYYSHAQFEASPLNRVNKTFAPGNSWAGSEGGTSEKAMQMQYLVNNANDNVLIWTITSNPLSYSNNDITTNIPIASGNYYTVGTLFKTVTIDEQGNAIVEYNNLDGNVVLKKVQIGAIAADYSGYSGFLCTYYVFDDLRQLRFVIPPKAVAQLITAGNWVLSTNMINELCYRYEYDDKQQMNAKKVPGAGWVYTIYDQRGLPVFIQDANQRNNNQWLGSVYDYLGREVETGMLTYAGTPAALQSYVTANTGDYFPPGQSTIPVNLDVTSRVAGVSLYLASNGITFEPGFVSEDGASYIGEIVQAGAGTFSTNPIPSGATLIPLSYAYYDNYSATAKTYDNSNNAKLDKDANPYSDPLQAQATAMTRGGVTSKKVRVIENAGDLTQGAWLETAMFYDDKGRVIQVKTDNYKGGVDVSTQLYDLYSGLLCRYEVHNNSLAGINNFTVKTYLDYDHEGRLLKVRKNLNDDANAAALNTTQRVIVQNVYDALGKMKEKQLGQQTAYNSAPSATPLEDDAYTYNIRGWQKGINWSYPGSGASTAQVNGSNKWFGMDLSYDWGYGTNQFTGNIAGQRWMSGGDGAERSYGYGYDAANRLLFGDFNQNFGGTWAKTDPANSSFTINFSTKMGDGQTAASAYDENGNIKQMQQYGLVFGSTQVTSQLIDNLQYNYELGGVSNKLSSVSDAAPAIPGVNLGDFTDKNTSGDDYGYDQNGNLLTDLNKRLNGSTGLDLTSGGAIQYNYLNLPWQIAVKNDDGTVKGTITYIYDASGTKLEKRISELAAAYNNNTAKQTTDSYLGSFVYENNALQYILHEEGRIRPVTPVAYNNNSSFAYDYFLKDHLGNTRTLLTDELEQDIYPAATLEGTYGSGTAAVDVEKTYYTIDPTKIVPAPAAVPAYQNNNGIFNNNPNGNSSSNSVEMYKVNGTANPTGLGITLKVMAGDKIDIYGKSFWQANAPTGSGNSPVTIAASNIVTSLLGAPTGNVVAHGATVTNIDANTIGTVTPLNNFLNRAQNGVIPVAYINYILFDDQFKYVGGGTSQVSGTINTLKDHHADLQNIAVPKNGYIYVYVSNQSPVDVLFDNLQVVQTRGPLVETNHYYPFGLAMAGLSDKALKMNYFQNRYKFNDGNELQNMEFTDGTGLEAYDAMHRFYDHQIGRFMQVDELGELNLGLSPYCFSNDNPVEFNDPTGLDPWTRKTNLTPVYVTAKHKVENLINTYWYYVNHHISFDGMRDKGVRNWLYQYDDLQKWISGVHKDIRETEETMLEYASWFIPVPVGELANLGRLVKFVNLGKLGKFASKFIFKREVISGLSDVMGQLVANKGDVTKINPVATVSAVFLKNPFVSAVVGSFVNLSISKIKEGGIISNWKDWHTYKSIAVNTVGNMLGDYIGEGLKKASSYIFAEFTGQATVAAATVKTDDMTNPPEGGEKKE